MACSKQGGTPVSSVGPTPPVAHASASTPQPAAASVNAPTEDQVLIAVSKALRAGKLLTRPDQCYAYRYDPAAGQSAYLVDVSENHIHAECGGDPQTQPHLFTVRIDKKSGAISQDAHTPGSFQPISP